MPDKANGLLRPAKHSVWKTLAAFVVAFAVVIAPAKTARAAISDCADAVAEAGELFKYLSGQASKIAGCSDKMTFSPPATAAVGVLVAIVYAAGQFNDEATCKGLVNSTISKMLAELLKGAPKVRGALEDVIGKSAVDALINQAGTSAGEALAELPGLDRVFGLMNCTCTVLGTGIETINRVKEISQDTAQCASTVAAAFVEGVEYLHCNYFGKCLTPGVQEYQCGGSVPIACAPGQSSKACWIAASIKNDAQRNAETEFCGGTVVCQGSATIDGKTSTPDFSQPLWSPYKSYPNSKVWVQTCFCPAGEGFVPGDSSHKCMPCSGQGHVVNAYGVCESWDCKEKPGLNMVKFGDQFGQCTYTPKCSGGAVWDPKTNSCGHCPDNTVFKNYGTEKNPTAGTCSECAYDEKLKYEQGAGGGWKVSAQGSVGSLTQLKCQKLHCEGLEHPDKKSPHECVPCKSVFNAGGVKLAGFGAKFGTKPVCLDNINTEKPPCKGSTVRYPDGRCHAPPVIASTTPGGKLRNPGGPIETKINPGDSVSRKAKGDTVTAPQLEGIGTGFSSGSSAPSGKTFSGQTTAPSGSNPGAYTPPGAYAPPGSFGAGNRNYKP